MNHKNLSFSYRVDDRYAIFETSSSVRAIRWSLRTEVNTKIHQPSSRPTLHIGRDFLGFIIGCSLRTGIWARGWWWLFLRPFLELHRVLVSLSTMDCWFTMTAVLPKLVDLAWWSRLVLLRRFSPEDWSFSIFPGRKCCWELIWNLGVTVVDRKSEDQCCCCFLFLSVKYGVVAGMPEVTAEVAAK